MPLAGASDIVKSRVIVGGDSLSDGVKTKEGVIVAIVQTTYHHLGSLKETKVSLETAQKRLGHSVS